MSSSILISWRSFWQSTATSTVGDINDDEHECRSSIRLINQKAIDQVNMATRATGEELKYKLHKQSDLLVHKKSYRKNDCCPIIDVKYNQPQETSKSIHLMKQSRLSKNKNEFKVKSCYQSSQSTHLVHKLFNIIKLSIQLVSLLTTVPIFLVCFQQEPHRQTDLVVERALVTPLKLISPVSNYKINSVPNIDQYDQQQQQQQQQQQASINWTNKQSDLNLAEINRNVQRIASDLWHSEQPMTRFTRPTFMSDFVSNQGQRIMKNFANSTIADLVAQPNAPTAVGSLLNPQRVNLPPISNPKYLPTMGKLYSFLFPNNIIQANLAKQTQSSLNLRPPLSKNQTNVDSLRPAYQIMSDPVQSAPSNKHQVYFNDVRIHNKLENPNQAIEEKRQQQQDRQQVINLSAPYESRPRALITSGQQLSRPPSSERSHNLGGNQVVEGENIGKLRRGFRPSSLIQPDGSASHLLYQDQQSTDVVNESEDQNSSYQPNNELVETGGAQTTDFDAINLRQHEAAQAEEAADPDHRKQETAGAENDNQLTDTQQDGDTLGNLQQYMQEAPYLGSDYGARKVVGKQNEFIEEQGSNKKFRPDFKQLAQLGDGQIEQAAISQADSSAPDIEQPAISHVETPYEHQENPAINQQVVADDEEDQIAQVNLPSSNGILPLQGKQQQEQQLNPITIDDTRNEVRANVSMFNRHAYDEPPLPDRPDYQYSFANDTTTTTVANDDSFLNLRLPSQYEATIRLPPEGYYDDYFKPASTNLAQNSAPKNSSSSPINNPESLPEFSLNLNTNEPTISVNQQQFELDDNSRLSNATSDGSQGQTHSDSLPSPIDYMKHYFQKTPKQNEPLLGTSKDFNTTNASLNSTLADDYPTQIGKSNYSSHTSKLDFRTPSVFEASNSGQSNSDNGNSGKKFYEKSSTSYLNKPNNINFHEDNIELIIANTHNSSRDPLSNEKLINYISEGGFNGTRQAGKPVRNTFVNKEMNEFPPIVEENKHRQTTSGPRLQTANDDNDDDDDSPVGQQQVRAPSLPENQNKQIVTSDGQTSEAENLDGLFSREQMNNDEEDQLRRVSTVSTNTNFGRYNKAVNHEQQPKSTGNVSLRSNNLSSEKMKQVRSSKQMSLTKPLQPLNQPIRQQRNTKQHQRQRVYGNLLNNYNQGASQQIRNRDKRDKQLQKKPSNRQHSQRLRPQVTQVQLNPRNLIAIPPTAAPSNLSPIEGVANLPLKVKKMRDNQPDKNELMNELLNALDRVKVAIYNLQPLTARMNAIYRKSITSNTRDIIMDNHKGTYAKRYPPGDFDNVYDRVQPQDMLDRQQQTGRRRGRSMPPHKTRDRSMADMMTSGESAASAVYLPAPQEVIDSYKLEHDHNQQPNSNSFETVNVPNHVGYNLNESKLVATGFGRRLGDGRVRSTLSLSAGDQQLRYDDEDGGAFNFANLASASSNTASRETLDAGNKSNVAAASQPLDYSPGPLFGYRITIYQSPTDDADKPDEMANNDQFSYQIEGDDDGSTLTGFKSIDSNSATGGEISERASGQAINDDGDNDDNDAMATSESTLTESNLAPTGSSLLQNRSESNMMNSESLRLNRTLQDPDQISAESKESMEKLENKKKKKKTIEEAKKGKSDSKEKGDKKKEKSKKSYSKKAKGEVGKKKKKEYKKIKHHKEISSKEKKVLHRDKHIKAHDRGAAKEKALKERTQIEFFEREQIVDDEFEKGKKSLVKAGWQSGHDQKKSFKDSSGEQISMGGSHYVSHSPKDGSESEKKHGAATEASSGKKSNKFMKKDMEAKGKKFKGWREKGYKIITETEFIDRGSLHDSAYKKRDKGGAHHQKHKKHKSMSEGHHGSMHEEHKKSHKKEEKKAKMHEKKAMKSKSAEQESNKSNKEKKNLGKASKDKENTSEAGDKVMSSNDVKPVAVEQPRLQENPSDETTEESVQNLRKYQHSSTQPSLMSASSSTFRPTLLEANQQQHGNSVTLSRLLNANHDEEMAPKFIRVEDRTNVIKNNDSIVLPNVTSRLENETVPPNHQRFLSRTTAAHHHLPELSNTSRLQHSSAAAAAAAQSDTNRHLDQMQSNHRGQQVQSTQQRQSTGIMTHSNRSSSVDKNNATILDIVDNLTGRQINKSKIGTYELEGHNTSVNDTAGVINGSINSAPNKVNNNMTGYVSALTPQGGFTNDSLISDRQQVNFRTPPAKRQQIHVPNISGTAAAMRLIVNSELQQLSNNVDGALLLSLLQKASGTMKQVNQEIKPMGDTAVFQRPSISNQPTIYAPQSSQNFEPAQRQPTNELIKTRQQQQPATQSPVTATRDEAAARLLRLVQSSGQAAAAINNPILNQQRQMNSNLLNLSERNQLANALNQRQHQNGYHYQNPLQTTYHQQSVSSRPAFQIFPSTVQPQFSLNGPAGYPSEQFGSEQLLDFELYPISRATHNILAE